MRYLAMKGNVPLEMHINKDEGLALTRFLFYLFNQSSRI